MGPVTTIPELRAALRSFPDVLLDVDDRRVLDDTLTSLEALEGIDVIPTVVAVVGSSGSGKSALVNAVIGHQVTDSGVVRPTTVRPVMVGGAGPVSLAVESEYVHVPHAPAGVVLIDTPPWEHDQDAVRATLDVADLVVVVITPSRYADVSVDELLATIPSGRRAAIILNRVSVPTEQRHELMASVEAAFGADVVVVEEGGPLEDVASALFDDLTIDTGGYERAAVFRSATASGVRHLARAVTAASRDIGAVSGAVEAVAPARFASATLTVFDEWPPTRADLVAGVSRSIHDVDAEIVDRAGTTLAPRIQSEMGRWDGDGELAIELDAWRSETVTAFRAAARIRWRRAAAIDQLERFAWRRAINPEAPIPARMRRIMGGRLGPTTTACHTSLVDVLSSARDRRVAAWRDDIDRVASFQPGELLALADGFASPGPLDG
jgi:GTPase SAR1 family protein